MQRGLLHKLSSSLSLTRNDTVISFLEDNFATMHELRSKDEDHMNDRSRPDSMASLCIGICFKLLSNSELKPKL